MSRAPLRPAGLAFVGCAMAMASFATAYSATKDARSTSAPPPAAPVPGMTWIAGGEFTTGDDSDLGAPDERPPHRVRVDGFWVDTAEVTNAEFQRFVDATGYVTTAERVPDAEQIRRQLPPGSLPVPKELLVPGSFIFVQPKTAVNPVDISQ